MGCLLESIFKYTLINLLQMGCLLGEYFQVHPYKSIEDGLPLGDYFQVSPVLIYCRWVAYWRVFSSSSL